MSRQFRQNVPSDFGTGGTGLTPEGSSVASPTPTGSAAPALGTPNLGPNPDIATVLWALLARIAPACATYATLAAFGAGPAPSNVLDRQDGMIVVVSQDNSIWRWNALSTAPASTGVTIPTDAPAAGRWELVVQSTFAATGFIPVDLKGSILAAGTPLGAFSSPNVGYVAVGSKSLGVRWHTGTLTTIWTEVDLPPDCDRDFPVYLSMLVSKTGATATDVVSMTVTAFPQAATFPPQVLEDASPNLGAVSPALTTAQASLPAGTVTKLQVPIGILPPNGTPSRLSFSITPSGTLATDDVVLEGVWIEYTKQFSVGRIPIDTRAAILAAGTPMAAWASTAGVSSSPGVSLSNAKAVVNKWNNQATQTPIWSYVDLPYDCDVTKPIVLRALASKTGATAGDATTFTCTIFQNLAGALEDAGSNLGGVTNALVGTLTAKTVSALQYVIPANTLTAAPNHLSISVQPTNGTLGTDIGVLDGFWLEYTKKPSAIGLSSFDLKAAVTVAAGVGTPMAAWASTAGASSSPGVTLSNSKAVGVKWNNNAVQTPVFTEAAIPFDFDVTQPCTLVCQVSKTGATLADTAPMNVSIWEQVPGSTDIGGPTFAGQTSAIATPTAAAKTISRLTMTIPANTFTQAPGQLTMSLSPLSGKLGTDNLLCTGAWIEYTPKAA